MSNTLLDEEGLEGLFDELPKDSKRRWKTIDGRVMEMEEMDDSHVENAIHYLERRGVVSVGIMARLKIKKREPTTPEEIEAKVEAALTDATHRTYAAYLDLLAEREWRRTTCGFNPLLPSVSLGSKGFPLPRVTRTGK